MLLGKFFGSRDLIQNQLDATLEFLFYLKLLNF